MRNQKSNRGGGGMVWMGGMERMGGGGMYAVPSHSPYLKQLFFSNSTTVWIKRLTVFCCLFIFISVHFSFQPVLHDWCNKGRGMCYPVCRMVHVKEPLLLIGKSSPCGGSRFPLLLSVWCFTNVWRHITVNKLCSASLNKTFPSFLISVLIPT